MPKIIKKSSNNVTEKKNVEKTVNNNKSVTPTSATSSVKKNVNVVSTTNSKKISLKGENKKKNNNDISIAMGGFASEKILPRTTVDVLISAVQEKIYNLDIFEDKLPLKVVRKLICSIDSTIKQIMLNHNVSVVLPGDNDNKINIVRGNIRNGKVSSINLPQQEDNEYNKVFSTPYIEGVYSFSLTEKENIRCKLDENGNLVDTEGNIIDVDKCNEEFKNKIFNKTSATKKTSKSKEAKHEEVEEEEFDEESENFSENEIEEEEFDDDSEFSEFDDDEFDGEFEEEE